MADKAHRLTDEKLEELAQMESARNQPTLEEQVAELREALELLLSGATE